jgi:hypothetical protein
MGAIRDFKPVGMTGTEYNDAISNRYALLGRMAGPDPYADQTANIEEQRKAIESSRGLGQASALFKAANAAVQGNNAMRGLAGAGAAYGEEAAKVAQAGAAEKRALSSMNFNLLDAQRKERMGMSREAIEAANQARKDKTDLNAAEIAKQKALGTLAAAGARATKPTGTGGAGSKLPQVDRQTAQMQDQLIDLKNNPNANPAQVKALEDKIAGRMKIIATGKDVGPEKAGIEMEKLAAATDKDIAAEVRKDKFMNNEWQLAMGDDKKQAEIVERMTNDAMTRRNNARAKVNNNSGTVTPIKIPD